MTTLRSLVVASFILGGGGALADETKPVDYAEFADTVPHLSLTQCPEIVAVQEATCHIAMIGAKLHVVAFARTGNQPFLAIYSENGTRAPKTLN